MEFVFTLLCFLLGRGDNLNLDDVHFDEELHFFGGGLENQVACREIIMLPTVARAAAGVPHADAFAAVSSMQ